jgi:hypothetical protein
VLIEDISISPSVLLNSPVLTHRAVNFLVTGGGCGTAAGTEAEPTPGFAELVTGS